MRGLDGMAGQIASRQAVRSSLIVLVVVSDEVHYLFTRKAPPANAQFEKGNLHSLLVEPQRSNIHIAIRSRRVVVMNKSGEHNNTIITPRQKNTVNWGQLRSGG